MVEKGWGHGELMQMQLSDLFYWINEAVKKHNRDNKPPD